MLTSLRQRRTPALRACFYLALFLTAGCLSPTLSSSTTEAAELAPELAVFEDWREAPRVSFEQALKIWNPNLFQHRLRPEDQVSLNLALSGLDEAAMRAALLLAHSRDPQAAGLLLARLEDRIKGTERNSDGADVVAAASLAAWPQGGRYANALSDLSIGERPHPDLEVRVECASAALARGRTETCSFLLRVLRAGTPAEELELQDWTPKETMAWAKSRSATALSRHLGVPVSFRADASYQDQLREIAAIESLLAESASSK